MASVLLELPGDVPVAGGLWYSTPASTRFGRHFHRELELNVVVTGAVSYWFPDRELRVVAPGVLWIPPGVEHELLDASSDVSMWVHSFRPHVALASRAAMSAQVPMSMFERMMAELKSLDGPMVTSIDPDALARLCARSREGLLRPNVVDFNAVLSDVLTLAWSGRRPLEGRRANSACHPAARRAANVLREADFVLSTEALAKTTRLSRERLSRIFTQSFGIGLVHYRNHHRVQRFIREYGLRGGGNMLRAALDVGFGSYVQFHRAFKQVTGYPPATHLERVRDGIVDPARTGSASLD